jgi:hypothetical protein
MIENFIKKSNIKHHYKYDYSLVKYVNARIKVTIICKEHGEFQQTPDSHSRGVGCPNCNGGVRYSKDKFINNARLKHGDLYNYDLVDYKNNNIKIKIICEIHGIFQQRPSDHLKYGCWKCGVDNRKKRHILTNNEFIFKCSVIHNNTYDYSKTNYINTKSKVTIICKEHGEFEQLANTHITGAGCPSCRESKAIKTLKGYLKNKNILFIPEKRFVDCRDIRPLPFDLFIPEYNLCIEYDGIQHSKPNSFFNKKNKFDDRVRKDKIKTEYCSGLGDRPNLLRFNHKQSSEEIFDILTAFFSEKVNGVFTR